MVFLRKAKPCCMSVYNRLKKPYSVWVFIFKDLLFSWVNLIFAPRKLTGLTMYQERSHERSPKNVKFKDKRLCACGPEGRGEQLGHITLTCIHMGHQAKVWMTVILNEHGRTCRKARF